MRKPSSLRSPRGSSVRSRAIESPSASELSPRTARRLAGASPCRRPAVGVFARRRHLGAVAALHLLAGDRLGDQDGAAEDRGDGEHRADDPRGGAAVDPGLVHRDVALALRDQPAVDRQGGEEGDEEREGERAPEEDVPEAGVHRAGDRGHERVVDDLHDRDREGVGGERDRDHGPEREPRPQQRQAGQRVAEEEGERDRERDRPQVAEPERGADRHPGDLADRTAGEAVEGGADGDAGEGAALGRHLVVVVVVIAHGAEM